ncbi:MAG: hypothetical protein OXP69_00145 [Spirochaetaceae bacterium]|nr:hypothetical protein [Spirochaetaceae bacterium]
MSRELPARLTTPAQLLVEGTEPKNLIRVLQQSWRLQEIEIHDFRGVKELRNYLKAFRVVTGFSGVTNLGIVRDAEESAESALTSVQNSLRAADLPMPESPDATGLGKPSVSVFILPEGVSKGSLKSLLWRSIEADPRARCINDYVACMELKDMTIAQGDKARVLAWLAAQRRPTDSIGVAARMHYWDPMHESFAEMRRFLEELTAK